jgi:hypothetical protein
LDAVSLEGFGRCSLDKVTETVSGLLALLGGTSEKTLEEDGCDVRTRSARVGEGRGGNETYEE